MKHRQYCCDASRDLYEEYYSRQNGGEIPVFAGRRFQRGHGLGSILGGFARRLVLPFFQTNATSMLKNVAKTGMEVADDVIEGRSLVDSVKRRVPVGKKEVLRTLCFSLSQQRDRENRQEGNNNFDDVVNIVVTSSHNGFRSRSVLRMYKVGIGPVFGAANSD